LLKALGDVLGFLQQPPRQYLQGGAADGDARIAKLIESRSAAKAARDFGEADRIRGELAAMGVQIKDTPAGTTWVRA
jgi:cysteinyl-tRNA synthetase